MELNTNANQPACYGAPGDIKTSNEEGRHSNGDIQEISQSSKVGSVVCKKVVPSIGPDSEASVLNGEYCGLDTQLSIDSVDIEILREEILAAEARELEVIENGLLNAGDEGHEECPRDENREGFEGTFVGEFKVTGSDLGHSQGYAGNHALQDKATQLRASSLAQAFLRKEEDGQAKSIESPNGGLLEDAFLQKGEEMGAENHEAASSEVNEIESKATEARDSGFMQVFLQKQAELLGSPNGGLREDTLLQEGEGMGAKNYEAPPSEDNNVRLANHASHWNGCKEGEGIGAKNYEAPPSEDNKVGLANHASQDEGDTSAPSETSEDNKVGLANHVLQHEGDMPVLSEDNKADCENHVLQHEGVMSAEAREAGLVPCHQDAQEIGHDESSSTSNVEVNGDTFSREDERTGTDKGNATLLDKSRADDGDPFLQDEKFDKLSEHSEEDDYMRGAFSGPIAFSGMLSYSGMISYSGQIPYSGNLSLHSDSSASTRSFAFPVLASEWNSSPAKIGQPDSRYFRRRRRWRPRFCCRRPTTLFD